MGLASFDEGGEVAVFDFGEEGVELILVPGGGEEFDAAICLCQGAFGLMTADGHDETVVAGMARALRPGGRLALSAFSAYFVAKHWSDTEFDAPAEIRSFDNDY